jgi:DNA-directed RNA polymerase sigma subunit (sigma70/sigma32)
MNRALTDEQIKLIARQYGRKKTPEQLANHFGVSKERIYQIANHLRSLGVNIPRIREKRYGQILKELKEENPKLFVKKKNKC